MTEEFNLSEERKKLFLEMDDLFANILSDIKKAIVTQEKEFIKRENSFRVENIEHMSEEFKIGVRHAIIEMSNERKKLVGENLK